MTDENGKQYELRIGTASQKDHDRFWSKVEKAEGDGCWTWNGPIDPWGYGRFAIRVEKRKNRFTEAHRAGWEFAMQQASPKGFDLHHKCENTRCVRPDHLELMTHRENIFKSNSPVALNHRKTECKYGHAFDKENTIWRDGEYGFPIRSCRICERRRWRETAARRRQRSSA